MKKSNNEYIILFNSYNNAVFVYKKLIKKGYKVNLISTPCTISSGCSYSVKFSEEDLPIVKNEAERNNIKIKAVYKIVLQQNTIDYKLIS